MSNESDEPCAKERAFAAHFIETHDRTMPAFQQRAADASKWTLAALLTVNGGGALATLNAADRFSNASAPASLFLVGMSLAVLSAVGVRLDYGSDFKRVNEWYGRAKRAISGLEDPVRVYDHITTGIFKEKRIRDYILQYSSSLFEVFSGASFIIGAIVAVSTVDPDSKANAARCSALQKDFLSPLPVRSDSREVFETLKCKAQGEGSVFAPYDGDEFGVAIERTRRAELPQR
jgi:hypothetical protein